MAARGIQEAQRQLCGGAQSPEAAKSRHTEAGKRLIKCTRCRDTAAKSCPRQASICQILVDLLLIEPPQASWHLVTKAKQRVLPQVEQEEECITNKLMKRLKQLRDEKQTLANEVEHEEEYLVNNLQKRLQKVNGEKIELENQLELEQEYIVNKLQKTVWQILTLVRPLVPSKVLSKRETRNLK